MVQPVLPTPFARLAVALQDTSAQDVPARTISKVSVRLMIDDNFQWPVQVEIPIDQSVFPNQDLQVDARLMLHDNDVLKSGDYLNSVTQTVQLNVPIDILLNRID